jgi:hypothetical protein
VPAAAPITEEDNLELLECARYGETEDLLALLDAGADVNFRDAGGNTALHKACANGHTGERVSACDARRRVSWLQRQRQARTLWVALV